MTELCEVCLGVASLERRVRVSHENPLERAFVASTGLLETVAWNRPGFSGHLKHLKNDGSGAPSLRGARAGGG